MLNTRVRKDQFQLLSSVLLNSVGTGLTWRAKILQVDRLKYFWCFYCSNRLISTWCNLLFAFFVCAKALSLQMVFFSLHKRDPFNYGYCVDWQQMVNKIRFSETQITKMFKEKQLQPYNVKCLILSQLSKVDVNQCSNDTKETSTILLIAMISLI